MNKEQFVIGADFGTDSVRTVIVDTADGREIGSNVQYYLRWKRGDYCDPGKNQFRQHPLDYLESFTESVKNALGACPAGTASKIAALSMDTTGSTPAPVDKNGTPLSLTENFKDNPNAMFVLWKDHTAVREAREINELAKSWGGVDFTKYEGGTYSSEWFFSKILHIYRNDSGVKQAAFSWVEHCDWMPAVLTGSTDPLKLKRSRCAAGHKAMWHADFHGLPSREFLSRLDPLLDGLRERLYTETYTSDTLVGYLTDEWKDKLDLSDASRIAVGVGAFDAHMGATGGEIEPYIFTRVMGTSTCDMLIAPIEEFGDKLIEGISGQVDGSIIPGMLGMEAGQSAFGDVYAWFRDVLAWPVRAGIVPGADPEAVSENIIPELSKAAEALSPGPGIPLSLDWLNGRRTPYANQELKGAVTGLSLGTDAPRLFRSLVEATAYGSKKIVDQFISQGVPVKGVIGLGGVAKKSPFVVQTVADVLNMPIRVARSEQVVALGAAMFAAVVGGLYPNVEAAQKGMGQGFEKEYRPIPENVSVYAKLYGKYEKLGKFVEEEL
jgi:L-ribulokinase